jgi:hypothetical protein
MLRKELGMFDNDRVCEKGIMNWKTPESAECT